MGLHEDFSPYMFNWVCTSIQEHRVRTLNSLISMQQILFFLRHFSHLHALLEPTHLLISEKSAPNTVFYVISMKKIPPPRPYLNLHVYLILDIFPTYTLFKFHAY